MPALKPSPFSRWQFHYVGRRFTLRIGDVFSLVKRYSRDITPAILYKNPAPLILRPDLFTFGLINFDERYARSDAP